jgi:hypothetical protein
VPAPAYTHHHMLGRLSSIVTKERLNGQKVMVVRCEEICMSGGLVHQRVVRQSVQPDGHEVIRDRALGPGLTAGVMVSGPPPVLLQVRHLHVPLEDRVLRNSLHKPRPPGGGGPVPPRVGARPLWACAPGPASGTQTSLPPGEEVRCRHGH